MGAAWAELTAHIAVKSARVDRSAALRFDDAITYALDGPRTQARDPAGIPGGRGCSEPLTRSCKRL